MAILCFRWILNQYVRLVLSPHRFLRNFNLSPGVGDLSLEDHVTDLVLPLFIMTIYTVDSNSYFAVIVLFLYLGLVRKQAGKP